MSHVKLGLVVAFAGLVAACDRVPPTEALRLSIQTGSVTATPSAGQLVIGNGSTERIRFAVLGRQYFETFLAQWCFGGADCGTPLDPGASTSVGNGQVEGAGGTGSEVIVFWWPESQPGATPEDRLRSVRRVEVTLR